MEKGCLLIVFIICFSIMMPMVSSDDPEYHITVVTNRPSYEPGYIVEITGVILYSDTTVASSEYIGIEIKRSNGIFDCFQPITDEQGIYQLFYQLNDSAPLGTYTITVAKGYERVTCSFDVVEDAPNLPPYIPSKPFPSNGSTGISNSVVLSWTGGDPKHTLGWLFPMTKWAIVAMVASGCLRRYLQGTTFLLFPQIS